MAAGSSLAGGVGPTDVGTGSVGWALSAVPDGVAVLVGGASAGGVGSGVKDAGWVGPSSLGEVVGNPLVGAVAGGVGSGVKDAGWVGASSLGEVVGNSLVGAVADGVGWVVEVGGVADGVGWVVEVGGVADGVGWVVKGAVVVGVAARGAGVGADAVAFPIGAAVVGLPGVPF